jgi:hypothetical protein
MKLKKMILTLALMVTTSSTAMASVQVGDIIDVSNQSNSHAIVIDQEWSTVRINPKTNMVVEIDNYQPGFAYHNAVVGNKYTTAIDGCNPVSDTNYQDNRYIVFEDTTTNNLVRETVVNGEIQEITIIHSSLKDC